MPRRRLRATRVPQVTSLPGLLLDVELHPLTAVRVDRALDQLMLGQVAEAVALTRLEDHAGAAHELRHDDALGAVDDERALLGHHREVAHEHRLLFDLAGVAVHEPGAHEDRRAVGHVLLLALLHRELGRRAQVLVEGVELQLELERLGEVLDRTDVAEGLGEAFLQEPLEALALDRDQVGELERLVQVGERVTLTGYRAGSHGSPHGVGCGRSARTGRAEATPTNGVGGQHDTATGDPIPTGTGSSTVAVHAFIGAGSASRPFATELRTP